MRVYIPKKNIIQKDFWFNRIKKLRILTLIIIGILWFRIFYLQVIKYSYYHKKAIRRSIVTYTIPAPRGLIITSDGKIIANNKAVFQLYIDLNMIKGKEDQVLYRLSKILNEPLGQLKEKFYMLKKRYFSRILLESNLNWNTVAKVMARLYYLPGVRIAVEAQRDYPFGKIYFHLLGYVGKITKREYLRLKSQGYSVDDYIGKRGLERALDAYLRGKDGYVEIEKDAQGRLGRVIKRVDPIPGDNLLITVNNSLQQEAYKLLKSKRGAIVVLGVKDGRILAMVSSPSIDPKDTRDYKKWRRITRLSSRPLINRALSAYPPGSTFKVITAIAGLMSGAIKGVNQLFYCKGYIKFKNMIFRCWKPGGHGWVNLIKAISESCDVYFYEVAERLDIDYLAKISREFGLGEKALGWVDESSGLVPDRKWKRRVFHQIWYPGETLLIAIGQGYLKATPLQMARVYMAIANGGYLYKPYLVEEIKPFKGRPMKFAPILERKLDIPQIYLRWVRIGLREAVKSGTGKEAYIPGLYVAGKTGTAQVVSSKVKEKRKRLKSHAWFVSYAGRRKPEIVSAVFIEHGGHGGSAAAPLAKKLYEFYFGIGNETDKN